MIRSRWIPFVLVTSLFAVASAVAADSAVEEMLKVLPDDVVVLVATGGGDAAGADFEKSILGQIWHDQNTQSFYQSIKTELLALARREADDPNIAGQIEMALDYARLVASRPFAVGIARAEVEEGPPVCAFAILDAGGRRAELNAAVVKLEAMLGADEIGSIQVGSVTMHTLRDNDDIPLYWGWVGRHFVIGVNDGRGAAVQHINDPRDVMPLALKATPGCSDVLLSYIDVQGALRIVDAFGRQEGAEKEMTILATVVQELGFRDIKTLTERIGFSGPDVVVHSLVEMPGPPTGLPATFKPVNPAWFRAVDARAVQAATLNWDVAAVYDLGMRIVKMASPDDLYPEIQEGLAELESEAGFRIRKGLLESLAGPAVFYSLPAGVMVEAPAGGLVVVAKLRDAALFEKTMGVLGEFVSAQAEGMLQVSSQKQPDGRTVHIWAAAPLAFAQMMPTWSVAEDHVIIGSNSALCSMGVEQLVAKGSDAKSLLGTEGYRKVEAGLPDNLISLTYTDSQAQFRQGMIQVQQLWPMLAMGAMQGGVKLPLMLPRLDSIAGKMQPSVQYSYFGPEGLHSYSRGPGVDVSMGSVAGVSLGVGILMPALSQVRRQAFRMTSATNLSGIGKACLIYANDHDDRFPPNLQTLVEEVEVSPKSLESKRKPDDFDGPSYVYVTGQTVAMHPGNIVAYEDTRYCTEGVNVLFLDSHVEFMKPEMFRKELQATYERLGREMPVIEFAFAPGQRSAPPAREIQDAKVTATKAQLRDLHTAVNQFRMDTGRYPAEDEGLIALVEQPADVTNWPQGGYLASREVPKDAWGHDIIYDLYPESGKPFVIRSLGRDGTEGGSGCDADLFSTD